MRGTRYERGHMVCVTWITHKKRGINPLERLGVYMSYQGDCEALRRRRRHQCPSAQCGHCQGGPAGAFKQEPTVLNKSLCHKCLSDGI
jgi:hypothetical protein